MTYWLSFAGTEGFRGIVLVDGCDTLAEAALMATCARANPGGEIAGFAFEPDDPRMEPSEREMMARLPRLTLLTRAQVEAAGVAGQSLREAEADGIDTSAAKAHIQVICDECN